VRARVLPVAALALAGLVPASSAEAQMECMGKDVYECLDLYAEEHEFWTRKDMFTYLVAAQAADWKTPEECGLGGDSSERKTYELARTGVEHMLGTALLRTKAETPEFMAWVRFRREYSIYAGAHIHGLLHMDDGDLKSRESHLVLVKKKWNDNRWGTVLHEGAHHGGVPGGGYYEELLEKFEECVERDEQAEDSIMKKLEEEGEFVEVRSVIPKRYPDNPGSGGGGGEECRLTLTAR